MCKPYWETKKYIEAENELETYDDSVKLIMEYRESEKQKDQQITELEKELELEHDEKVDLKYRCDILKMENVELKGRLSSERLEVCQKIWDFIKDNREYSKDEDEIHISKTKLHNFLNYTYSGVDKWISNQN